MRILHRRSLHVPMPDPSDGTGILFVSNTTWIILAIIALVLVAVVLPLMFGNFINADGRGFGGMGP